MSSDDKNNNILTNSLLNAGSDMSKLYAVAGAALVGGAVYYYMNNSVKSKLIAGFDYSNQTREIQVNWTNVLFILFLNVKH